MCIQAGQGGTQTQAGQGGKDAPPGVDAAGGEGGGGEGGAASSGRAYVAPSGHEYYHNETSGETTWTKPLGSAQYKGKKKYNDDDNAYTNDKDNQYNIMIMIMIISTI